MLKLAKVEKMGMVFQYGIKSWAATLCLAMAAIVALPAGAMGHKSDHGFGGMGMFHARSEHLDRALDHWLRGLNVTDTQRGQITQIAQLAAADLKTQRVTARGLREQGQNLLTAPVVDAASIEVVRQQTLAHHDQISRRVTQALVDISNVLTPQQRAKLGEHLQQRAQRFHKRMEGKTGEKVVH